jgi:hypothetical protein
MNSAANVMKRHNMTDDEHHHFLRAPKGMFKVDGPLCLRLFPALPFRCALKIPFTHSACKRDHFFNEIKIVPFHLRIYVHLQPLPAHSFALCLRSALRQTTHEKNIE